jgi:hypothetical protein
MAFSLSRAMDFQPETRRASGTRVGVLARKARRAMRLAWLMDQAGSRAALRQDWRCRLVGQPVSGSRCQQAVAMKAERLLSAVAGSARERRKPVAPELQSDLPAPASSWRDRPKSVPSPGRLGRGRRLWTYRPSRKSLGPCSLLPAVFSVSPHARRRASLRRYPLADWRRSPPKQTTQRR